MPLVSILLPVYNGALYLHEAITSILEQTFTDFELIIVNDCSTDNSAEVIQSFTDNRIVFLQNDTNRRTSYCLNRGIDIAKGKYLARMDQDDISLPTRIEEQVKFMEANQAIGISGTQLKVFGKDVISTESNYPIQHSEIQLMQLYVAPFAHPTVIMRKEVLDKHNLRYIENIIAEDYSLWARLLLVTTSTNLPQVLLHYRRHSTSITKIFFKVIRKERKIIQIDYCRNLFRLESNFIPGLIFSGNPITRKIGLSLLKRKNKIFPALEVEKYFIKLNRYFWESSYGAYYFKRIIEKIQGKP